VDIYIYKLVLGLLLMHKFILMKYYYAKN